MPDPNAAYHADPAHSASRLKKALTCTQRKFWEPITPNDAMRQGSLVDCLALTRDQFDTRYVLMPEGMDRRTKAGKEKYAELQADGREIISMEWLKIADMICVELEADPEINALLKQSCQQPHWFYDDDRNHCRYMPDIEGPGLLVDLKKTANPHPAAFAADAYRRGYDVQMAHYLLGHLDRYGETLNGTLPRVGFLCYEWSDNPDVGLYWLPGEWLDEGLRRRKIAIDRVNEWTANHSRRSYPEQTLPMPRGFGSDTIATLDPSHF